MNRKQRLRIEPRFRSVDYELLLRHQLAYSVALCILSKRCKILTQDACIVVEHEVDISTGTTLDYLRPPKYHKR